MTCLRILVPLMDPYELIKPIRTSLRDVFPICVLVSVCKFFKIIFLFCLFNLFQHRYFSVLSFLIVASFLPCCFSAYYRPTSVNKGTAVRLLCSSFVLLLERLCFLYGLTLCGPLRTVLLTEFTQCVFVSAFKSLFSRKKHNARIRGTVLLIAAFIITFTLDFDANFHEHAVGNFSSKARMKHIFHHLFAHFGLSDHKSGVLFLILFSILRGILIIFSSNMDAIPNFFIHVSSGSYALLLITLCVSYLLPVSIPDLPLTWPSKDIMAMGIFAVMAGLVMFVVDFEVDKFASSRIDSVLHARFGSMFPFLVAMSLSILFPQNFTGLHALSGGVWLSFLSVLLAANMLANPMKTNRGCLIGYSADGIPLYNLESGFNEPPSCILSTINNGLQEILARSDSRRIFYFLCINLAFTGVEMFYGVWTNSLGLISDGFHMLFDCTALVMGLYASLMSRWKPTRIFSYGYGRIELLSGFVNGLFLSIVGFFVFVEAVGRIFDPPEIKTERLLAVSVAGLVVNLIGVTAFSHSHSHGGGSCHGHASGRGGHSHVGGSHYHVGGEHIHSDGGRYHGHAHGPAVGNRAFDHQLNPQHKFECNEHFHTSPEHNNNLMLPHNMNVLKGNVTTTADSSNVKGSQGPKSAHNCGAYECANGHVDQSHGRDAYISFENLSGHSETLEHGHNANMQGVFLHVLADTLGSVGVIISSLLIQKFGWNIADPLCSMFIASMILLSVMPLLRQAAEALMLRIPREIERNYYNAIQQISAIPGLLTYRDACIWRVNSSCLVGTIHVLVADDSDQNAIVDRIKKIFRTLNVENVTIQVEKEAFHHYFGGIGSGYLYSGFLANPGSKSMDVSNSSKLCAKQY